MTRHSDPTPDGQDVHHWLTRHQHALTHTLDELLDVEAGLREILLQSHHDTAVDSLDTVLNTEAGLAAILPTPPTAPHSNTEAADAEELLRALTPADRMTLRNHSDVKTASQALARYADVARDLVRTRDLALNVALDLALDLDRTLALDLDRALARTRALDLARTRTRTLDVDVARALASALDLAIARTRDLDLTLNSTHHLDLDRDLRRIGYLTLALALDRARTLARDRDLTLDLALDLACDRARALDLALDLARDLSRDPDFDLDFAHDLIVKIRTAEVGRAIGQALRRNRPAVDEVSLHALLDDFTTADLRDTDLADIDLSGVHWSEHTTRWPPAVDVEDLKTRSDETPPGTGTWIVRSGTATIRDLAER
ncbi:hypothetical protein ABZ642_45850 [Streptomyces sp. NPDC007157]|uniref:hypothetical protein n=1 Tax=Streptomyces sp. NPDC007157 TaxID=3154681 RepID=UPI0033FBCEDB